MQITVLFLPFLILPSLLVCDFCLFLSLLWRAVYICGSLFRFTLSDFGVEVSWPPHHTDCVPTSSVLWKRLCNLGVVLIKSFELTHGDSPLPLANHPHHPSGWKPSRGCEKDSRSQLSPRQNLPIGNGLGCSGSGQSPLAQLSSEHPRECRRALPAMHPRWSGKCSPG